MTRTRRLLPPLLLLAIAIAIASARPVRAVDGVIEINQARALAGGVTASDTAGFPITIDHGGSYRLTGDLTVPDANTTAIEVDATGTEVTIDLNGFSILGPVVCSGLPVTSCSPVGRGSGIVSTDATGRLRVLNGNVRGVGSFGVYGVGSVSVESLHVLYATWGIEGFSPDSQVTNSVVEKVLHDGIHVGSFGMVRGCSTLGNGGAGIVASNESNVASSIASQNGVFGITVGLGSTVVDCTANENVSWGLADFAGSGVTLTGYARNVFGQNNGGNSNPQVSGSNLVQTGTNVCGQGAC
jgi:hypothetical protein